ncbi:hypothetical protein [Streptomyces sp. 2132.2]|uniref:hypothetical protein n=1 Tax=Streptomyces sp. 2132.2 TaxID=2485161 RepID=UPI0011CE5596|nr:hypothetical protein [Streptomyces sp. 2132.2]
MTEIIAAIIAGVSAIGAAAVTVQWRRSRVTDNSSVPELSESGAARQLAENPLPASTNSPSGVTINAPHSGQIIGTNNGTVSQTNYRNGNSKR